MLAPSASPLLVNPFGDQLLCAAVSIGLVATVAAGAIMGCKRPRADSIGAAVPPASLLADARLGGGPGVASVVLQLTDMALIAVWLAH